MNPSKNVFVTGFPGPVGTALVARLFERFAPAASVSCLVEPRLMALAETKRREIARRCERPAELLRLVAGGIGRYDLGSSPDERGERATSDIFHLASLTDPAAAREDAYAANVEGTRHVLDMAFRCPKLRRFHYLSTCYVSGGFDGLFGEDDFQVGQVFQNPFEETKFLAELEVRQRMREGLDATIYRPALVIPDPANASADERGLEQLLPFLFRLARLSVAPVPGDPSRYRVNAVPESFVADAIDYLGSLPQSRGRVYHLCDPSAPTVEDLLRVLQDVQGKRGRSLSLPPRLARFALARSGALRRRMGVSPELFDYVARTTRYSSRYALRDLAPARITCPPLASVLPRLFAAGAAKSGRTPAAAS